MKKKLVSFLLALCLLAALTPAVLADNATPSPSPTSQNTDYIAFYLTQYTLKAGDTIVVSEKIAQNAFAQVEAGDLVDTLLDRGAVELASRVGDSRAKLEAARAAAPALASVKVTTPEAGAAVEVDGVVVGTTPGAFQIRPGVHEVRVSKEGYATWEKSVAFADGMELSVPLELSAVGLDRKGELEAQAIAREQSEADAFATKTVAGGTAQASSNSFIRLEGMPNESLTLGGDADGDGGGAAAVNVIQQEIK